MSTLILCVCVRRNVGKVYTGLKGTARFGTQFESLHRFSLDFEFVISFSKFLGTVILWTIFLEIVEENSFRRNILEDYIHKDNLLMVQRSIRDHT